MDRFSEIFNFDNVGTKIKNLVKWSCWISIILLWIGAIISFCVLVSDRWTAYFCWIPLVFAIVGPFLIWLSSWLLYAFGEMVEDIHAMRTKYYPLAEEAEVRKAEEKARIEAEEKARREAEEGEKQEAEKRANFEVKNPEEEQPKGQKCQLCEGYFEHLTICEINDDMGTRYRKICDGCMHTHNAKKVIL